MKESRIICVSGFSGTGKGTMLRKLLAESPDQYALSVSITTRAPRPGEQEGVDYYYRTNEEFEQMIKEDGFIEYAGYVDHYYGTPKKFVVDNLESGKDVFLEIEVQGAFQVRKKYPETILIFVVPPSIPELQRRLRERNTETEETIRKRLERAAEEVDFIPEYDYLLVNDDLDTAVRELKNILSAEHNKTIYKTDILKTLKKELGGIK